MNDSDSLTAQVDDMVADPDNGIVFISELKEKELLDLLVRLAIKAKSVKSRHWLRHGYLLGMGKVLQKIYVMNLHRWGLDDGRSREELEAFEKHFKDKLFGDFMHINQMILTLMNQKKQQNSKEKISD